MSSTDYGVPYVAVRERRSPKWNDRIGEPGFVVIGTGRSGTRHMADTLRSSSGNERNAGRLEIGHEKFFHPHEPSRTHFNLDGEVSWMGLPAVEQHLWEGPVVHVVRNPVTTIASLLGIGFFTSTDPNDPEQRYLGFAYAHCQEIRRHVNIVPLIAAVNWWAVWNERCAAVADVTLQVEDMSSSFLERVAVAIGFDVTDAVRASTSANHREHPDLPYPTIEEIWERLDGRATQFGYSPNGRIAI